MPRGDGRGSQANRGVRQQLTVADAQRLDPPLLPKGQGDEEAQLHQLGNREVLVKLRPERVVGDPGVPDDGAGVRESNLLPLGELVRLGEVQQLVVLLLGESLPSRLDGSLDPSVLALDGFRHVDPAELFEAVV